MDRTQEETSGDHPALAAFFAERPFEIGEEVKLRCKPEVTGIVLAIHQLNNVPCVVNLAGWGDRWFEEVQHLDEPNEPWA